MSKNSSKIIYLIFHSLGLSCLAGAVFLQALVFTDILQHGYFAAVESNLAVLSLEIFLTVFALVYYLYVWTRIVKSIEKQRVGVGV